MALHGHCLGIHENPNSDALYFHRWNMSNQQPLSASVRMNQVKTEDIYQPGVPEPCIQTPVYPPTSHNLNCKHVWKHIY